MLKAPHVMALDDYRAAMEFVGCGLSLFERPVWCDAMENARLILTVRYFRTFACFAVWVFLVATAASPLLAIIQTFLVSSVREMPEWGGFTEANPWL